MSKQEMSDGEAYWASELASEKEVMDALRREKLPSMLRAKRQRSIISAIASAARADPGPPRLPVMGDREEPFDLCSDTEEDDYDTEEEEEELERSKKRARIAAAVPPKLKPFRFNTKKIGITLANQVGLEECDKDDILDALKEHFRANWDTKTQYAVAQEHHKDGKKHFHVYLKFATRCTKSGNTIKVLGHKFVFNAKNVWNAEGWKKYISKEDENVLTNMVGGLLGASNGKELLQRMRAEKGEYTALKDFQQVFAGWQAVTEGTRSDYKSPYKKESFNFPGPVVSYFESAAGHKEGDRRQILVLSGRSRLGKTAMIRWLVQEHGSGSYHQHLFNFDTEARNGGVFTILDDIKEGEPGSATCPPLKGWTQDNLFTQTGKYRPGKEMGRKFAIVLCNDLPLWMQDDYWKKNCIHVDIKDKCYK